MHQEKTAATAAAIAKRGGVMGLKQASECGYAVKSTWLLVQFFLPRSCTSQTCSRSLQLQKVLSLLWQRPSLSALLTCATMQAK